MKWFVVVLVFLAYGGIAWGFSTLGEGCSGDCSGCHSISTDEAAGIVKGLDPSLTVESAGPSPVRGLYQVTARKGGDTGIFYLDFAKSHLILGRVLDVKQKKDLTQAELEERRRIDPARIQVENALILGNKVGARKLYVFTDPECPYCGKLHKELLELVKADKDLAVYIILMPLDIHPNALWKSDSIICKSKENMAEGLKLLDENFAGQELKHGECGKGYGEAGKKLGRELGIEMTPTMVFGNGKAVAGVREKGEIAKLLDAVK